MKRPSFQFYPSDWQSDLKLRRCTPAARGVWMDVLCAFHDSDDGYGMLRWPLKDIASTVGASMAHVKELADKGVLRGSDTNLAEPFVYTPRSGRKDGEPVTLIPAGPGPVWYSQRMVKDEHVRTTRGESTRFGADDGDAPKPAKKSAPKPPFGDGSTSSSSPSGEEVSEEAKASSSSSGTTDLVGEGTGKAKPPRAKLPPCPHEQIVELYHAALPSLPEVRVLDDARRKGIHALWAFALTTKRPDGTPRATGASTALTWVREFFAMASRNDFVMGREGRGAGHENWRATLDYLCSHKGIKRVIEQTEVPA